MKKYLIIFLVAIFFAGAAVAMAEQPSVWTKGNFRYERVDGGIKVTQISQPQVNTRQTQQMPGQQAGQIPLPPPVDKSVLSAAIKSVQSKIETDYTQDSWQVLDSALTFAQNVNSKASAAQSEVNAAAISLTDALAGLVSVPAPAPVETPSPAPEIAPLENITSPSTETPAPAPETPVTPPANIVFNISSVAPISDINVDYGTDIASANLPTTITATLSGSTTQSVNVTWDGGTPAYDGNTASTYVFSGTLTLPDNITNTNNLTASVNVIVGSQPPTPPPAPPTAGDIIQNAAASLINGVGNFVRFMFSPLKNIFK